MVIGVQNILSPGFVERACHGFLHLFFLHLDNFEVDILHIYFISEVLLESLNYYSTTNTRNLVTKNREEVSEDANSCW